AGSLPTEVQAQALRALERAEARHTAARARILAAFTPQDGYECDGQGSARTWLRWQAKVTRGAAAAATAWARRLAATPGIARTLAEGEISASWAREFCDWSDRLPADKRDDADAILTGAAHGGAELADLAGLAVEMCQRCRQDCPDEDDGFGDRAGWLGVTLGGGRRGGGQPASGCPPPLFAGPGSLGGKGRAEGRRRPAPHPRRAP